MKRCLAVLWCVWMAACVPRSKPDFVSRADQAAQRGDKKEAARWYQKAYDAGVRDAALSLKLAQSRSELGDRMGAVKLLAEAMERWPDCGRCYGMLGLLAIEDREFDRAETLLRNALKFDPADVGARNNLGYVFLMRRDLARAYEAYAQALAFEPMDPIANVNLARICRDFFRDTECARKHFERYLQVSPAGEDALSIRAWLQELEEHGNTLPSLAPTPMPAPSEAAQPSQPSNDQYYDFYISMARDSQKKAKSAVEFEVALRYAQKAAALRPTEEAKSLIAELLKSLGR